MTALITKIEEAGYKDGTYRVWWGSGGAHMFKVFAKDELDAFQIATKEIKERTMTERYLIVAATVIVLALTTAVTSCVSSNRSSDTKRFEACLAKGMPVSFGDNGIQCGAVKVVTVTKEPG